MAFGQVQDASRIGASLRPVRGRFSKLRERIVEACLLAAASSAVVITAAIVAILLYESSTFFAHVSLVEFFTDTEWTPLFPNPRYGILPPDSGPLTHSLDTGSTPFR